MSTFYLLFYLHTFVRIYIYRDWDIYRISRTLFRAFSRLCEEILAKLKDQSKELPASNCDSRFTEAIGALGIRVPLMGICRVPLNGFGVIQGRVIEAIRAQVRGAKAAQ